MNSKMKWAYKALRIGDAVDAALEMAPKVIIWSGIAMILWLAVGLDPIVCMVTYASMACLFLLLVIVDIATYVTVRLLGFDEEELERLALA